MAEQYFGKYTGIVADNRDAEVLGRVKVSVPAIFPPDETVLARPALPYGFCFVPEKGAKVWVEFEGGDPGLPLWTGVQYVAGEWPPEGKADPPQYRVVRSAAGHVLLFDDKAGEEKVEIADGAHHHRITLSSDGITLEHGGSGHRLTIGSGNIRAELDGGAAIELSGSGVKVDGGMGVVEVKGSTIRLGEGALQVLRVGDSGIGNLGAPVIMTVAGNTKVLA